MSLEVTYDVRTRAALTREMLERVLESVASGKWVLVYTRSNVLGETLEAFVEVAGEKYSTVVVGDNVHVFDGDGMGLGTATFVDPFSNAAVRGYYG